MAASDILSIEDRLEALGRKSISLLIEEKEWVKEKLENNPTRSEKEELKEDLKKLRAKLREARAQYEAHRLLSIPCLLPPDFPC
jgi:seryl-tRNA synthetase